MSGSGNSGKGLPLGANSGPTNSGGTSDGIHFPDCLPGCSAKHGQHKAGATSSGDNGDAQNVGQVKANLDRLATDLAGGDLHCGNFYAWLEEATQDLANRCDGSSMSEVSDAQAQIGITRQITLQFRASLREAVDAVRKVTARL